MINNYSTIRVQFEVQYIRVGGILVGLSYCKQSHTTKACPRNKSLDFAQIPAYIMFRKSGIVLHTDRDRSFVRLDNGDIRNTDIS